LKGGFEKIKGLILLVLFGVELTKGSEGRRFVIAEGESFLKHLICDYQVPKLHVSSTTKHEERRLRQIVAF
jgi:hypothetical protein